MGHALFVGQELIEVLAVSLKQILAISELISIEQEKGNSQGR